MKKCLEGWDKTAMCKKIPLLVVCGPTASGKTAAAVTLAKKFRGEVISADSMQIYKHMDIGTAKPALDETCGIPHHLLDILEPSENFSLAAYVKLAGEAIAGIHARGALPVLAGGTGLYISTLIDGVSLTEMESSPGLRKELEDIAKERGADYLWNILNETDPEAAGMIHPNNIGRVVRAIEVHRLTGVTMSEQRRRSRETRSPYDVKIIGLGFANRENLYHRISIRVDDMIEAGLVEEAGRLMDKYSETASQAIGYKELIPYLNGEQTLGEAVENIKRETRRYAKRQLTWFRRDNNVVWFNVDEYSKEALIEALSAIVKTWLDERGIAI